MEKKKNVRHRKKAKKYLRLSLTRKKCAIWLAERSTILTAFVLCFNICTLWLNKKNTTFNFRSGNIEMYSLETDTLSVKISSVKSDEVFEKIRHF